MRQNEKIKDNFSARFDDFYIFRDVIRFVRDPLTISTSAEFSANVMKVMSLDEGSLQSELAEIQAADDMKATLRVTESLSTFWVSCPEDYIKDARHVCVFTMFLSTYTCEALFSNRNFLKAH